ncbi:hypothetical protein D6827_00220, partial [Candidatus Parcubacteria bacterium]
MSQEKNIKLNCQKTGQTKTGTDLLRCTVHIGSQAGKHISQPIRLLWQKKYWRSRSRLHKILDIVSLIGLILTTTAVIFLAWPQKTQNLIDIQASVAPEQVITGGESTLDFIYTNNSKEKIKNAVLKMDFPDHFTVNALNTENASQNGQQEFFLGDIAPGEYGAIHISGIMFGDVGGEQTFTSTLQYTYGEDNTKTEQTATHKFFPVDSALQLQLILPDYKISGQKINGQITYTNNGDIKFPNMKIMPEWPSSFRLISTSPNLQSDNSFHISGIEPQETGTIEFTGILGNPDDSTFIFNPSFTFNDAEYRQTALNKTVDILPSPLTISHSAPDIITPGDQAIFTIFYKNISQNTLRDLQFKILTDPTIFYGETIDEGYSAAEIDSLTPGEEGSLSVKLKTKGNFSITTKNPTLRSTTAVNFKLEVDGEKITANTRDKSVSSKISSPLAMQSFGRYWTASGDQLGRGPWPPEPGGSPVGADYGLLALQPEPLSGTLA